MSRATHKYKSSVSISHPLLDDLFLDVHRRPGDYSVQYVQQLLDKTSVDLQRTYTTRRYFNGKQTNLFGYNTEKREHQSYDNLKLSGYFYANLLLIDHEGYTEHTNPKQINKMFDTIEQIYSNCKGRFLFIQTLREGLCTNIDKLVVESVLVNTNKYSGNDDIIGDIVRMMDVKELEYLVGTKPGNFLIPEIAYVLGVAGCHNKNKLIEYIRMTPVVRLGIMLYSVFRGAGELV
jgi:hypothetical protein